MILPFLSSCYMASYDGSNLSDAESAKVRIQNYLSVVAYKKRGNTAAEERLGVLRWNSKIPAGKYRLEVSIDEPEFGKSFIPISLELFAKPNTSYWIAYQRKHGFGSNKWRPYISTTEPNGFYGLFEFWKKDK